jgi:hypothetical protein
MTAPDRRPPAGRLEGPLYLDTSALVKLYISEPESVWLDRALRGRRDLIVSDLAVTELASALGRRCRELVLTASVAARIYRRVLSDVGERLLRRVDLTPEVHREAERMLLSSGLAPLRSLDALHVALAAMNDARTVVTFDRTLGRAAASVGMLTAPGPAARG